MNAFADYLSAINKNRDHGDATEHTHRPAMKTLLEAVDNSIIATNEPTRILCGAPDFNITRKKVPLGHVETKDIQTNLDEIERGKGPHGEQFKRYLTLPNWILTDYLEFRWFVAGEKRLTARIGEIDAKGKLKSFPDGEEKLAQLLNAFFKQEALTIGTAKELAQRMAGMTGIIRDLIVKTFEHEKEKGWLHNWLTAFRETLIPELDEAQFADMFAQTLAYGLFAARVHTPPKKEFSREMAAYNLPKTNPFLRKLFSEIAGVDMPETIDWAVDDVVELLKHADMFEILKDFGKGKGKEDPVVHFYETFLAAYDPKMREVRGVYYTPEPVVSYIVRSVDHLLKTRFKRIKGLADDNTLILDPATGTATFLYFVIDQIYQKFAKQKGAWDGYVEKHLLNRIFGFELLVAPYAIAHLKLGMQLQQSGYQFGSDQRLGIYLTNTLEEAAKKSEHLFAGWIAEEANAAAKIKRDEPILVVLGNPPYSGHSANRSDEIINVEKGSRYSAGLKLEQGKLVEDDKIAREKGTVKVPNFIGRLLLDYYLEDSPTPGLKQWLDEKNAKWLQNDYVKFIRFAQWRIDKTGEGIIGFITSNSYLDGPIFRGMRQSLMRSFNDIFIYDLHGNSNKKERALDGGEDKNVFDITEGVSLMLCVKEKGNKNLAQVFRADILGTREVKYKRLAETDMSQTKWEELNPVSPNYFFMPQAIKRRKEYEKFWLITEMMPKNLLGFQTHRDPVAVALDEASLKKQVTQYLGKQPSDVDWKANCHRCDYRPFDQRFVYLHASVTERPRLDIIAHLFKPNLALNTVRQTKASTWQHAVVSNRPTPAVFIEIKDGSNVFPLYLYDNPKAKGRKRDSGTMLMTVLFDSAAGYSTRRANLNPKFIADLTERLGFKWLPVDRGDLKMTIGPEDVFNYAYAVFHSPTYQQRYAEFLKTDFPRLPLTSNLKLFRALAGKGAELVALHLVESPKLNDFITEFPAKGSNEVEKVQYTDKDKRVWINAEQYFGGVPKPVWGFHIGGNQVCDKWLKDRKGRKLDIDDINHYQKIVVALNETIRIMAEIDGLIPGWPLA
ncbi:MAG: type ISP restriction/modification enzyme [Verrucomicrobiota bacterium]